MQAREALYDREDDILKAWHENIEEAQQNDKKFPPLKLGITATVDLEESKIETTLRFTAVYQSRIEAEIADPNQPDLPGVIAKSVLKMKKDLAKSGASVSIIRNGETVYDSKDDADEGPEIVERESIEIPPEPLPIKGRKLGSKSRASKPEGSSDDY